MTTTTSAKGAAPRQRPCRPWLLGALALWASGVHAADADWRRCASIADNAQRLTCFDQATVAPAPNPSPVTTAPLAPAEPPLARPSATASLPPLPAASSTVQATALEYRWDLTPEDRDRVFEVRRHKPVYLLPVTYATSMNQGVVRDSGTVQTASGRPVTLDRVEAKFQLSLKTRAVAGMLWGEHGDLWLGYTQSSRWQILNKDASRPFRETNYEPEAIVSFATNYSVLGWTGRVANVSLNHQSNGRAEPLSRSWNRVIGELGFERGDWTVSVRPWLRIQEKRSQDDNPDIEDHVGRGEVVVTRQWGTHVMSVQARHTLRGGERSRGSLQFDYAYPLSGQMFGYLQVFHGYGESLIDYNFKTTKLGLGVSLVQWR